MNLKEWLYRSHTPAEQLKVLEGVCSALHEAHSRGEIRNGIGPENVQIVSDTEYTIEPPGVIPVSHRAPEDRPTPTTGIFSAGVILYEILTGKNPFGGSSPGSAQPTPLKSIRRDITGDLSDAIMACLESDPDWRPKDLSYVLQVVQRLRSSGAPPTPPPISAARVSRAPSRRTTTRSPRFDHVQRQRRGGSSYIAIILGVLVIGGVGYWFWQNKAQDLIRPTPTTVPRSTVPPSSVPAAGGSPSPEAASRATPVPTPFVAVVDTRPTPPSVFATPMLQPTPMTVPISTPAPIKPTPFVVFNPTPRPLPTRMIVQITPPPPPLTPAPTVAPTPPPPSEPATLNAIAPRTMTRGQKSLYDLHGGGIRADHRPVILKGGSTAPGVTVAQTKLVNSTLLRMLVNVDGNVAPGSYSIVLVDASGKSSNAVSFEITN
jgi:serine/threonine protein kinase